MQSKLFTLLILFVAAMFLIPVGMDQFADSDVGSRTDTFTGVDTSTESQDVTLTRIPVIDDTDVVTVEGATLTRDTDYTIVNTTGVVTLSTNTIDATDTIAASYDYTIDFGAATDLWVLIPILAILVIGWMFWKRAQGG